MEEEKKGWFTRFKAGIQTATKFKRETPEGLWFQCTNCNETSTRKELKENSHVCPSCDFHPRIGSEDYFKLIFDGKYQVFF